MPDAQNSSAVLLNILRVLERIERKLDKQEERFDQLKTPPATNNGNTSKDPSIEEDSSPSEHPHISGLEGKELHLNEDHMPSTQNGSTQNGSNPEASMEIRSLIRPAAQLIETPKIHYSHWSFGQAYREIDDRFKDTLHKHFGEYCQIPLDNRLPLRTFKSVNHNIEGFLWESQAVINNVSISSFEKRLALFRRFDTVLRSHKGNDFLVIDYDLANNTRLYRVGQKAVGDELMVLPEGPENAPWSRLMYSLERSFVNTANGDAASTKA